MLTPADIEKKQFTTVRLREGYDQTEVDDFLDLTAAELTTAQTEVVTLRNRIAVLQRQLDTYGSQPTETIPTIQPGPPQPPMPEFLGDVSRILSVAQQSADEQIAEAAAKAQALVAEAEGKAASLLGQAVTDADQAKTRAQGELYAMQTKLSDMVHRHDSIKAFLAEHLTALKDKLEETPDATS